MAEAKGYKPLALGVAALAGLPIAVARAGSSPHAVLATALASGAAALYAVSASAGKSLLVSERGRWSLSSFQLLLWTWLILSTLWALVVLRIRGHLSPLGFDVDQRLWLLIGISSASFVAAPLADQQHSERLARRGPAAVAAAGVRDLVTGDASATADVVDLGRVQMLFFTLVTVAAYAATVWEQLCTSTDASLRFPGLSDGLLALLGISHLTYIANKLPRRDGGSA